MNIDFLKKKKNFKKKNLELSPSFYWKLIVLLVFILILASFTFGYYLFNKTREESVLTPGNLNRKQIIEKGRIEKVLGYFSLRQKKSIEILNSPTSIVDPSL